MQVSRRGVLQREMNNLLLRLLEFDPIRQISVQHKERENAPITKRGDGRD